MFEQVQRDEQHPVAVTSTKAAADVVTTLLAAHGIRATTVAVDQAFPSLNWVVGYQVVVSPHEQAWVRELLDALRNKDDSAGAGDHWTTLDDDGNPT